MKFKVIDMQVDEGLVCYKIADNNNDVIGTVYHDGIRTWKCVGTDGLLINDASIRRRMYAAVRVFNAATTFPGIVPHKRHI